MGQSAYDTARHNKMPLAPSLPLSQQTAPRKPSLKEQPSYLKEVSIAINRGDELRKLKERLSAARLIMEKVPTAKPWMLSRSISNSSLTAKPAALKQRLRSVSRESSSDDAL